MNDTSKAPPYSIKVYKQYFNFASSHFLIFGDGTREPLHGHNYKVSVEGTSEALDKDMVFDFLDIKPVVREICQELDHRLLLPQKHPTLKIESKDKNFEVTCPDKSFFSFPKQDILLLPIENTSAERIAIYFSHELAKRIKKKFDFIFKSLSIEIEETPGQSAMFQLRGDSL